MVFAQYECSLRQAVKGPTGSGPASPRPGTLASPEWFQGLRMMPHPVGSYTIASHWADMPASHTALPHPIRCHACASSPALHHACTSELCPPIAPRMVHRHQSWNLYRWRRLNHRRSRNQPTRGPRAMFLCPKRCGAGTPRHCLKHVSRMGESQRRSSRPSCWPARDTGTCTVVLVTAF